MPNLAGKRLNTNKSLGFALQTVFGIGKTRANQLCAFGLVHPLMPTKSVQELSFEKIRLLLRDRIFLERDLKGITYSHINKLSSIKSTRGVRCEHHLPVHGQRTRSNACTARHILKKKKKTCSSCPTCNNNIIITMIRRLKTRKRRIKAPKRIAKHIHSNSAETSKELKLIDIHTFERIDNIKFIILSFTKKNIRISLLNRSKRLLITKTTTSLGYEKRAKRLAPAMQQLVTFALRDRKTIINRIIVLIYGTNLRLQRAFVKLIKKYSYWFRVGRIFWNPKIPYGTMRTQKRRRGKA